MKKYIANTLFIVVVGFTFLYSCRPAKEIGPTEIPYKVIVNVSFPGTSYGTFINQNTKASVSTNGEDFANIVLSINRSDVHTGQIFIKQQLDNGASKPLATNNIYEATNDSTHAIKDSSKYVFTKGDTINQTYTVPAQIDGVFNLTIPVRLRKKEPVADTTGESNTGKTIEPIADTYTIWITKRGETGDFNDPTKGLAYGIATVTFNYTAEGLITQYSTSLGNSVSGNMKPSCLASSTEAIYLLNTAKDSLKGKLIAPNIDFIYNNTEPGKFVFGSIKKSSTAFDFNTVVTNGLTGTDKDLNRLSSVTSMAETKYTSSDFDNIKIFKNLIDAVDTYIPPKSINNNTHVVYTKDPKGEVFAFKTSAGYRGLARISETPSGDGTDSGSVILDVKVQR
jgi:hypothetical protein